MKKKLKWEITLYSSDKELFSTEIPVGCTSERKVKELLRSLVAKEGLTYEEIADCYTNCNAKRHAHHLEITEEGTKTRYILSCGQNPYATAVVNHGGKSGERMGDYPAK